MFGSAFKQRAHYVFNYKPRYFSERKERLENLKEKYADDKNESSGDAYKGSLIRNNLKNDWAKSKKLATDSGSSKRLAIIIAILVGICSYIFELHTLI
tara:strand:+ start:24576 stop:24869 length:294 start_codon:yes stop_codon:yes gene_type:complete